MTGRHWVWRDADARATAGDLKARYAALRARGIDGVFLSGGIDEREFDAVREAGLELHAWMWTLNRRDPWIRERHPEWYQVSRSGRSCFDDPPYVDYYRWVSPFVPEVADYLEERVAELAAHPAVAGVHLDYVRFPDVVLPRALWAKYGLDQTEELPDYDFDYGEAARRAFRESDGRDPLWIADPAHDAAWLRFRYDAVTRLVGRLAAVARGRGKAITAAVFPTPRLARRICRQDWEGWPLDAAFPMLYQSFYDEPVSWIGECVLEDVQAARFPVFAGLFMPALEDPAAFGTALRDARRRGGAGVSLFGGVSEANWAVFGRFREEG